LRDQVIAWRLVVAPLLGLTTLHPRYTPTVPIIVIRALLNAVRKIGGRYPVIRAGREIVLVAVDLVDGSELWFSV